MAEEQIKTVNGHRVKIGGYSHKKLTARRNRRRDEAEVRQDEYNRLTTKQKLARAQKRGGSVREITKLQKRLDAEKAAAAETPTKAPSKPVKAKK